MEGQTEGRRVGGGEGGSESASGRVEEEMGGCREGQKDGRIDWNQGGRERMGVHACLEEKGVCRYAAHHSLVFLLEPSGSDSIFFLFPALLHVATSMPCFSASWISSDVDCICSMYLGSLK